MFEQCDNNNIYLIDDISNIFLNHEKHFFRELIYYYK